MGVKALAIPKETEIFLVVMAGGSGTRFWPKSTSSCPKQLLSFGSDQKTLLENTLDRFSGWVNPSHQMIVTTRKLAAPISDLLSGRAEILAEPTGRNTAPCIYWAARFIQERANSRAVMIVVPSDHFIFNLASYQESLKTAVEWAATHSDLVTLGIEPSRPETGYGYLKKGESLGDVCFQVEQFVEKPDFPTAQEYMNSKNYLWNGGMFVWSVETILNSFDQHLPEMKEVWERGDGKIETVYPNLPATSIDYGVMEKAFNVVTVPLRCGWDDVGNWTSLEDAELSERLQTRAGENTLLGGDLISVDSKGCIVDSDSKLVSLLGVKDLVVVEHEGAILVADKSRAQDIRRVVEEVKKKHPERA